MIIVFLIKNVLQSKKYMAILYYQIIEHFKISILTKSIEHSKDVQEHIQVFRRSLF